MSQQAMAIAQKGLPWRRNLAWWVVGIEGAILTLVGIYVVAQPDDARDIVRQIIGWFLLVNALLAIAATLREEGPISSIVPYRMLAAGVGLTVGLLVVLEPVSDYVDEDAARVILALGLLGNGLIGLAGAFATRASGGLRRGALIVGGLNVALAILLFYNVRKESLDPRWFGIVAIGGGVLVMGYAFALYQSTHKQAAAASTVAPPVADTVAPPRTPVEAPVRTPVAPPAPVAAESSMPASDAAESIIPERPAVADDGRAPETSERV